MKKDLVSILVPVYNVQDYLPDCLKCIEQQTYKKIEVVFVNDGSTDNSLQILKDFCSKHSYAKLFNQKNRGIANVRNKLIGEIKGEFFYFLDSDDLMNTNTIEHFVQIQKKTNADIVTANFDFIPQDEHISEKINKQISPQFETILGSDLCCATYLSKYKSNFSRMLWNKLFKTSILKEIKLYPNVFNPKILFGEDTYFMCEYVPLCQKVCCVDDKTYLYRKRVNSAIQTKFSPQMLNLLICTSPLDKLSSENFPKTKINQKAFLCRMARLILERMKSKKWYDCATAKSTYKIFNENLKYTPKTFNNWKAKFTKMSKFRIYLIYRHILKKGNNNE